MPENWRSKFVSAQRTNSRINERDANVELLRIFACIVVIGTHIKLTNYEVDGIVNKSQLIVGSFFGEGVTIFFLILGFFYFNNRSFKKLVSRTVKSILIPAGIYIIFAIVFQRWIRGETRFVNCLTITNISNIYVGEILGGICSWTSSTIPLGAHLWYIFTYVQCILWFPVLRYLGNDTRSRRYVEIIGVVTLLLENIQQIMSPSFGKIMGYSIVPVAILQMLIGYEIYQKREVIRKNKWFSRICGLAGYFILHGIGTAVSIYNLEADMQIRWAWDSIIAIMEAVSITMFFFSFQISEMAKRVINWLSSHTYWIYLIHMAVYNRLDYLGVRESIYQANGGESANVIGEMLYTVEYSLLIFFVSLIIAFIVKKGVNFLKWFFAKQQINVDCKNG